MVRCHARRVLMAHDLLVLMSRARHGHPKAQKIRRSPRRKYLRS
jgi:hypothetical protein